MPKVCLMCGGSFPDSTTFCPRDGSALRAAVKGDDLIGELIGERYMITDLISHGGMGSVYLASDVRLPQQFAVKVLKDQMSPDPAVISRFRQEAEAVCRINHDRVARVFDFGFMDDGRAYIIMEYAKGRTLKDLMDDRAPLSVTEASKITTMIAEGLDAAHRLSIVHRDLKPENVMVLDDPGGGMRIKVLDFGIAKLIDNESSQGYTQPGFVIGTPMWMSPEQLRGDALDARSDVYSLALLTFAMLTNERPFVGATEQAEMLARLAAAPRTLAEVLPNVAWPAELQAIFDRTLSREEDDRPSSAMSFAEAIAKVSAHSVADARGASVTPPQAASASGLQMAAPNASHQPSPTPVSSSAPHATVVANAALTPATSSRNKMMATGGIGIAAVALIAVAILRPFGGSGSTPDNTSTAFPPMTPSEQTAGPATTPDTAALLGAADSAGSETREPPVAPEKVAQVPPKQVASTPPAKAAATPPVTKPPTTSGGTGATGTPPASASPIDAELQRLMDAFDRDNGASNARTTAGKLGTLLPRLSTSLDKGWAHLYLGMSQATLSDKEAACASFKQASANSAGSNTLSGLTLDWRTTMGCGPRL